MKEADNQGLVQEGALMGSLEIALGASDLALSVTRRYYCMRPPGGCVIVPASILAICAAEATEDD